MLTAPAVSIVPNWLILGDEVYREKREPNYLSEHSQYGDHSGIELPVFAHFLPNAGYRELWRGVAV